MKQIVVIVAVFVFFFSYNITQAQTKEETISWIKEKINKYKRKYASDYSIPSIESINECEITLKYDRGHDENVWANYTVVIPTSGVLIDGDGDIRSREESIRVEKHYIENGNSFSEFNKRSSIDLAKGEYDLYARLVKGFAYLNKFCPVRKEPF